MRQARAVHLGVLSLIIALAAGCAADGTDEESRDRYRFAFGQDHEDWSDRPRLFRELFGGEGAPREESEEERVERLEAALAAVDERRAEERPPVRPDHLRERIGIIIEGDGGDAERAFRAVAADYPLIVTGTVATQDALAGAGCDADSVSRCADAVNRDPGLRAIARIRLDGREARWSGHDLALDTAHRERTATLPALEGEVPAAAYRAFADKVLLATLDRLEGAPWHARVRGEDGDGWLINAGAAAGLQEGQALRVHAAPDILRDDSGNAMAWRPGAPRGRVEVEALTGEHGAVVVPVDGDPPNRDSVLLPPGD